MGASTSTIWLIAHNIRSCHNVGSLLRLSDGLGVSTVFFTGYTPYPKHKNDKRLPHIATRVHERIVKTSLGAEKSVQWQQADHLESVIKKVRTEHITLIGLEQDRQAQKLPDMRVGGPVAILLGEEVKGIPEEQKLICDLLVEIPMLGKKESFNVTTAAAMTLYQLRFFSIGSGLSA